MIAFQRRAVAALLAMSIAAAPMTALAQVVKIPEGAELLIRFDDKLSSATNTEGDQFSISLDESVKLADGTVIAEGYRGKGEVTSASKRGYMGKAGELNVRLHYIRIGETRVRLRASKSGEGKGAMGATIALTVLFGPLGLLKRGHDIEIKEGQTLTAYVDQDADLTTPLSPPPVAD
ncbi:MAG: hypothetical protein V4759_07715 [Pseudomonadota bacterium]